MNLAKTSKKYDFNFLRNLCSLKSEFTETVHPLIAAASDPRQEITWHIPLIAYGGGVIGLLLPVDDC